MDESARPATVEIVISGPGHHDRAERARPVIAAVAALGLEVAVATDLRPRLADDMRALLEAGSVHVRLSAEGIVGELRSAGAPTPDGLGSGGPGDRIGAPGTAVVVVLRAGPHLDAVVRGEGDVADSVRVAVAGVGPTEGDPSDPVDGAARR